MHARKIKVVKIEFPARSIRIRRVVSVDCHSVMGARAHNLSQFVQRTKKGKSYNASGRKAMCRRFTFLFILMLPQIVAFSRPTYYVGLGISKPYAHELDQQNVYNGYNIGLGIGKNIKPTFEIQGQFLYEHFGRDYSDTFFHRDGPISNVNGGTTSFYGLYADFRYLSPLQFNKTVTPYIVCSLGGVFTYISEKRTIIGDLQKFPSHSQTNFAAGIGMGFEALVGKRTWFVLEGRFNLLFSKCSIATIPLKVGIAVR